METRHLGPIVGTPLSNVGQREGRSVKLSTKRTFRFPVFRDAIESGLTALARLPQTLLTELPLHRWRYATLPARQRVKKMPSNEPPILRSPAIAIRSARPAAVFKSILREKSRDERKSLHTARRRGEKRLLFDRSIGFARKIETSDGKESTIKG